MNYVLEQMEEFQAADVILMFGQLTGIIFLEHVSWFSFFYYSRNKELCT